MAYRRKTRGRSGSSYRKRAGGRKTYSRRTSRTRRTARSTRGRTRSQPQTLRIVIEQPTSMSPTQALREMGMTASPAAPRKAKF